MSGQTIVPGSSEGGVCEGFRKSPRHSRGVPALRFQLLKPRASVKGAGCLARFYRAVDWGYVGFVLAWATTAVVLLHLAWGRAG